MNAQTNAPAPKVEAPANSKPAVEAKAPKAKPEPKTCACKVPGCSSKTTRIFAPGHDAKLVGHLTREVVKGSLTKDAAIATLNQRSEGSKLLASKLATAIPRELDKANAANKRAQAQADAKAAKAAKDQLVKDQIAAAKADKAAQAAATK